jgi:hypothetical protein
MATTASSNTFVAVRFRLVVSIFLVYRLLVFFVVLCVRARVLVRISHWFFAPCV